jgi:WD40 repeat protein
MKANTIGFAAMLSLMLLALSCANSNSGKNLDAPPVQSAVSPEQLLNDLRNFYLKTAREDGSFQPGIDPQYLGMADTAHSDLAAVTYACTISKTFGWTLPHEAKTTEFLLSRQKPSGEFFNVAGTVDPNGAEGKTYNTTQGLVALHALGTKPKYNPLPIFEDILKGDYKTLPAFSTSFFPLAYGCYGAALPPKADRGIRALMVQDETGYTNDHIAATFHASHYYSLIGEPTPKSRQMVDRILRDQKPDGSWMLNMPSRDRHATFDAVFTLLHEGGDRPDCKAAIARAAKWALSCRNTDGGFGHYPGSTSDADATYFQVGTLVMAGVLKPADPLPKDPQFLSWGHLMPLRKPANVVRLECGGWVGAVAFGDDNLATGSSDGQVRIWNPTTGKLLQALKAHDNAITGLSFSIGDKLLASSSFDGTVKVWNMADGNLRYTCKGHHGAVTCVEFFTRPMLLATGGIDGTVRIWDSATGELKQTFTGHKSWVNAIAIDPFFNNIFSASSDGTIKQWAPSGECKKTVQATKAEVRSLALWDGDILAAGMRYGAIKVWDTRTWNEQANITGLAGDVWSLAFRSKDELISGSGDWNLPGQITVWDPSSGKQIRQTNHTGEVLSIADSPKGDFLAVGGGDGTVTIIPQPK